jgi:hypothetical protein
MKRLSTFVFALLLAGSLSFAQDTGSKSAGTGTQKPAADDSAKKGHKGGKKGHKGGKKSKKGAGDTGTAPPPK